MNSFLFQSNFLKLFQIIHVNEHMQESNLVENNVKVNFLLLVFLYVFWRVMRGIPVLLKEFGSCPYIFFFPGASLPLTEVNEIILLYVISRA